MIRLFEIYIVLVYPTGLLQAKQAVLTINRYVLRISFLISLLFLFSDGLLAQNNKIIEALQNVKEGKLDQAIILINEASKNDTTKVLAHTWFYKGYIYYELYNRDKNIDGIERSLAVDFFSKSLEIDDTGRHAVNCRLQINNISISFYNDAVNYIYSENPEKARNSFDIFLQVALIENPKVDLESKKIGIYNALGGLYTKFYDTNRGASRTYLELAEEYYNKVIEIDSLDAEANYNIGILYYNVAVKIINGTEYDIDLVALDDIQDTSMVLFKQSLPFMRYALKINPDNEDVLNGLKGIYFALNDTERRKEIETKLDALKAKE